MPPVGETVQLYGHTFYKRKPVLLDDAARQRPDDWQTAFFFASIDAGQVCTDGEYKLFTGNEEARPKRWTCFRSLAQLSDYINDACIMLLRVLLTHIRTIRCAPRLLYHGRVAD